MRKLKKRNLKLFFSSAAVTAALVFTVCITYLSFCRIYEAVRKNGFNDQRPAVIITESYVKFFDFEFFY